LLLLYRAAHLVTAGRFPRHPAPVQIRTVAQFVDFDMQEESLGDVHG
jgi:hypothetical protein